MLWARAEDGTSMFLILWEFEVKPGCEQSFESAYGPDGTWMRLFSVIRATSTPSSSSISPALKSILPSTFGTPNSLLIHSLRQIAKTSRHSIASRNTSRPASSISTPTSDLNLPIHLPKQACGPNRRAASPLAPAV
jgi:hypothetical protein